MRNPLKLHGRQGGPAMAAMLLCVMGCTPLLGCLFPQDDQQVIGELPPKRNSPLKIVSQDPSDPRTTFYNSTRCPDKNPSFKLIVEDEDLDNAVSSLWFIGKTTTQPFAPSPLGPGTQRRSVAAPSSLGFKSALANLTAGTPGFPSTQVLTVYVADTAFKETVDGQIALVDRPPKTLPDGTIGQDIGSYDSFTWTLDVEPCP